MGGVNYVPLYESFYNIARYLDDEKRLKFFDALCEYGFSGAIPEWLGDDITLTVAFEGARPNIDASISRQIKGRNGGRPKRDEE